MEEEDPTLYESPPPWQSSSKVVRRFIKPIGQVLLVMGLVILAGGIIALFIGFGILCSGFFLLTALLFITSGAAARILSHSAATDRMDTWAIRLVFSRELFRRVSYDVEQYLRSSGYRYTYGPDNYGYVGRVKGERNFTVYLQPNQYLIIRMALVYEHDPEYADRHDFFLNISNITKGNLENAKVIAKQIYNILYSHHYWLWKDDYDY